MKQLKYNFGRSAKDKYLFGPDETRGLIVGYCDTYYYWDVQHFDLASRQTSMDI